MTNLVQERDRIRSIGGFVSSAMGDGWVVDTSERVANRSGVYLDGPNKARLLLHIGNQNPDYGRLIVHGVFPIGHQYNKPTGIARITLAADRDPGIIAKEVTRRLLPDYTTAMAETLSRLQDDAMAEQTRRATIERLSALPGVTHPYGHAVDRLYLSFFGDVSGEVDVAYSGDSLTLTICRATVNQAEAIFTILAAREEPASALL